MNVSGATVDRGDYGGGDALAGWAISVMMGDAAVEGAPTMLDDDGNAAFTTTVASVPASFTFSVADDQDDALDGGEMYEGSDGAYTHTGLKVAGDAADADPIVVTYKTQTLKVYVHHERDQVRGYTGNALDGDKRMSGLVDLEVRQASGNDGRFTGPISNDDWDSRANTGDNRRGEYTFSHLPADMDIVVRADAMDGYMLLDLDRIDTYRNLEENGVMGGAFGAMGGWGHTVTLCPLTETEPTGQDFGECGSFAVVSTYDVSANVSKNGVRKSGTGFRENHPSDTRKSGITVSLSPVEGKNLAGVGREFTTASSNDPTTPIDERKYHDFGTMAAGVYELGLPDGWMAMAGGMKAADALSPLGDHLALEVTPSTATLYGFVGNTQGVGLENVTVTVNGQTGTTDNLGRYIVSGISAVRGQLFVNTARAGYPAAKADSTNNANTAVPEFAANTTTRHDISLSGSNNTVAITGTVTESGTGAPIKGVEIRVDGKAPLNAGSGQGSGKVTTADDGTYTAIVQTQPFNDPLVNVSAHKSGYHFLPHPSPVAAIAGANPTANFEGRKATEIFGRVTAPGGGMPRSEVTVRAYADMDRTDTLDAVTTTETGTFSVFVPTLSGTVYLDAQAREPTAADLSDPNWANVNNSAMYDWFDPPATRPNGSIAVIPGQVLQFGTFSGHSVQPRITSVERGVVETETATIPAGGAFANLVKGETTNTIVVEWEYDTRNAADAGTPTSYSVADGATITVGGVAGAGGTSVTLPPEASASGPPAVVGRDVERTNVADGTTVTHKRTTTYTIDATTGGGNYGERDITVGVVALGKDAAATAANVPSASVELAAVASGATNVTPKVDVTGTGTAADPLEHNLTVSWRGAGSPGLEHRILLSVDGRWLVFGDPGLAAPTVTRATADSDRGKTSWGRWSSAAVNLISATDDAEWEDEDGGSRAVALEDLLAVGHVRVDTRVTGSGAWTKGTSAAVSR